VAVTHTKRVGPMVRRAATVTPARDPIAVRVNADPLNGVRVLNVPTAGQVLTALSATTASWQAPTGGGSVLSSVIPQTIPFTIGA